MAALEKKKTGRPNGIPIILSSLEASLENLALRIREGHKLPNDVLARLANVTEDSIAKYRASEKIDSSDLQAIKLAEKQAGNKVWDKEFLIQALGESKEKTIKRMFSESDSAFSEKSIKLVCRVLGIELEVIVEEQYLHRFKKTKLRTAITNKKHDRKQEDPYFDVDSYEPNVEKFYGREFVFSRIEQFLNERSKGYLTIIGQPGIGKSAIVGQYYHNHRNSCIAYSCAKKPELFKFIRYVCEQLQEKCSLLPQQIAEINSYDQDFLEHYLEQVSNWLIEREQKLVIAVDAVEDAKMLSEYEGQNILCLPEQPPENIYFLLARRPFDKNQERLWADAGIPKEYLNLDDPTYIQNNYDDIIEYLEGYLNNSELSVSLNQWLDNSRLTRADFVRIAAEKSESNFMYVKYLVYAIAGGLYTETDFTKLPAGLDGYYRNHWQRMKMSDADRQHKARILYTLLELEAPATSIVLSAIVGQPVHSVNSFLESWIPFLKHKQVENKTYYSIYHASFADFLREELREEKTGLTIKEINASIDDYLEQRKYKFIDLQEIYLQRPNYQIKANRSQLLCETLTNYQFIFRKVNHYKFGINSLLNDYIKAFDSESLLSIKQIDLLDTVSKALRLSSHIIFKDKTQLSGQLWGRLLDSETLFNSNSLIIIQLLRQLKNKQSGQWLRPIKNCFEWQKDAEPIRTLNEHNASIGDVVITPDGRRAVSGSLDGTFIVWDLDTGNQLKSFSNHNYSIHVIAITPDGRRAVSGSWEGLFVVWNLDKDNELISFVEHTSPIHVIAITPDGRRAVSGSWYGDVSVWDLDNNTVLDSFNTHTVVNAVAIFPDGQRVIYGSAMSRTLMIWELDSGIKLSLLNKHIYSVGAITITLDGCKAISISGDSKLIVWDLTSNVELSSRYLPTTLNDGIFDDIKVTSDNKIAFITSSLYGIIVWNLESNTIVTLFNKANTYNWVDAVDVSLISQRIISGSGDGKLKIWNFNAYDKVSTPIKHNASIKLLAIASVANQMFISREGVEKEIEIYNLESNNKTSIFSVSHDIRAFDVTPNGSKIACGLKNGMVRIWDVEKAIEIHSFEHKSPIEAIAISFDYCQLASSSEDGVIKVWDINAEQELVSFDRDIEFNNVVAISSDGSKVISNVEDYAFKVWDFNNRINLEFLTGHQYPINAIAVSPDDTKVIFGFDDGTIKVWDLLQKRAICNFCCDTSIAYCSMKSDNSTILASDILGNVYFLKLEN